MSCNRKEWIVEMVQTFRRNDQFSVLFGTGVSACVNIVFLLFNGIFGCLYLSVWHLSVCFYYAFLLGIRGYILMSIRKRRAPRAVYIRTHIFLLLMNLVMILPVAVMVNGERQFTYGLIPAIAMAAYTTYRITMAIIGMKRSKRKSSLLVRELRAINFVDALMALMALQNTLIMANGGMTQSMRSLCAWSNGGIVCLILFTVIRSFCFVKAFSQEE